jgi:glycosyltransferase involved in cell wall biosynthesis
MSRATILYELFNLSISGGTGIATYARNLCSNARELGYDTDGLLHSYRAIDKRDPILAEVSFFDARNREISPFDRFATRPWRWAMGAPFGIAPAALPNGQIVVQATADRSMASFGNLYVANLFMEKARFHFKRFGSAARLKLKKSPDIFHATQAIPLAVPGAANIYTIHDIVPLRLPQSTLDDKKYFLELTRYLGKTASKIATVSEYSRQDLIKFCGIPEEKVVNTYQSVSFPDEIERMTLEEASRIVQSTFDLAPKDYYLFHGALEPKKNVGRLLDAYVASGTRRRLVLAGGLGWEYQGDLEKIENARSNILRIEDRRIVPDERVRRLQLLPLFQLAALIRCARAVVFPSLYEGFGLPVLESMLLGTPVVTSNSTSLKEIAEGAALLVDPTSTGSIMTAIQRLDADGDLIDRLVGAGHVRARQFSPARYKERLAGLYESVLDGASITASSSSK